MSQDTQVPIEVLKKCPKCHEDIQKKATKCKHCGADLRSWINRHPLLTILIIIIGMPITISTIAMVQQSTEIPEPATPLTPEQIAELEAEKAAFDKTEAGKLCLKHPTWTKEDCIGIVDDKIWIGMTLEMLEAKNGKPTSHNVSSYGMGIKNQYCWSNRSPRCYYDNNEDGIIDAFN